MTAAELEIIPIKHPVIGTIQPPGSKSITNRVLPIAAMANGSSLLTGCLASEDTAVMLESLKRLGIFWKKQGTTNISMDGCGGKIPREMADLWLENSGTSIRFLTALCACGNGTYRLDGNERMRERPIQDLVNALKLQEIDIRCELENRCPPVELKTGGWQGGRIEVAGNLSSQYLSALLMMAPYAKSKVTIHVTGELVSVPYIEMTLAVMASFGVQVESKNLQQFVIEPQCYQGREYAIEPDASAASYFLAAAAITGGQVTIPGLSRNSLQGDVLFAEALEQMGCLVDWQENSITVTGQPLRGIDIDMNAISDTAQTLAAVAVFAEGPTRVRNVEHMRIKETDRVAAVVTELQKLGIKTEEHTDGFTITPGPLRPASVATYNDHRMAMSFSLIGLKSPGVRIQNPGCTAKTYPHFFEDLQAICQSNGG